MMNKYTKTIFFIIGLAVFSYLINNFGFDNIITNVKKTGWWFVPVVGIWGVVYYLNAWAWYLVIDAKQKKIPFIEVLKITISGFAINYVTPFVNLGGEPYRILMLKEPIGTHSAISSVILYTMLHFLSHFFFWVTAILCALILLPLSTELKIILVAALLILSVFIWFVFRRHKRGVFESLLNFITKVPLLKRLKKKLEPKENSLMKIDKEIKHLFNNRKNAFFSALVLDYLSRMVGALEFLFILKAIGMDISFLEAFYISAGSSLIINIFFFMPFELGTREGSLYLVLDSIKLTAGIGIYVGIINRVREFFWILIGLLLIQFNGIKKDGKTEGKKDLLEYISDDSQ
ncbi:MAG: flippase-like domain-containing protein [Bacteroidetes bacterium]|nr:flippase-like domain-containing protein [Bacteroidota bacterium]